MDGHLIANVLIVALGIVLWIGNSKRKKAVNHKPQNDQATYQELLVKLKYILETSELEIFKIAAKEYKFPEYVAEKDFKAYLDSNAERLTMYLTRFLDDGRTHIEDIKVATWRCNMPW